MEHYVGWILVVLGITTIVTTDAGVAKVGNRVITGRPTDQNNTAYLLDHPFGVDGVIFAISAYFMDIHPIGIGVFRPRDANDRSAGYTLVQQWTYSAIKANRREDIYLQSLTPDQSCFRADSDDRLGLYITHKNGSVAYDFVNGNNVKTLQLRMETPPNVGGLFKFDVLSWPYQFSLAAYLDTDVGRYPAGETNPLCFNDLQIPAEEDGYEAVDSTGPMGATGSTGETGPAGATGSPGQRGDRGPTGEHGATGQPGQSGAVGATGQQGVQGSTGPIGPAGPVGGRGMTGTKGEKGDTGVPGPDGNITMITVQAAASGLFSFEDCSWCPKFLSPYLVLALVIWLVIVTICLFITILVICCKKDPKPQHYQRNITTNDDLWKKYENGGFDEKHMPKEDNTYSAIEEGRTEF